MTNISTGAFFDRANQQLTGLRNRAQSLQGQIGSGERLSRSSDDPVAAARLRDLARNSAFLAVDQANSDRATADLNLADDALTSIASVIIRARELATQAANGSLSDHDRQLIGQEVASLGSGLLAFANSRDSTGHALFGGEAVGTAYLASPGGATYLGTLAPAQIGLSDGQTVSRNLAGPDVFGFSSNGTNTDLFATLASLSGALASGGEAAKDAASAALGTLDAGLEKITTAQTVVGARLGWIETVADRRTAQTDQMAEEEALIGGTDLAATITRLQETLTVLEASQASFVRLTGLSLFNQLR